MVYKNCMNIVATNAQVLDESSPQDFYADSAYERPSFFRRCYIKLFHWWLYFDGKRVMRDYRKGKLSRIESLDELMK